MGTYRRVFIPSKFSSVENANKKHKSSVSAREKNGVVNVCIFDGMKSLIGKLKAFVEEKVRILIIHRLRHVSTTTRTRLCI